MPLLNQLLSPPPAGPGMIPLLPATGRAHQANLIIASFHSREEIPRRYRLDVPIAYDLAAGIPSATRNDRGTGSPRRP